MNPKKIFGIAVAVVGAIMLFFSNEISNRVAAGRAQISSGQRSVDTANKLFSVNPNTEKVGKFFTSPAQQRINEGTAEANMYESMAGKIKIGGIILLIAGAAIFILLGKKRS